LVGRGELDAGEAALLQRAQKLNPEAARLDLTDIQPDDLPHPGLMHRVGDDQRLGHHAAVVADLDVLSVQP
jgi:hypothetical protein